MGQCTWNWQTRIGISVHANRKKKSCWPEGQSQGETWGDVQEEHYCTTLGSTSAVQWEEHNLGMQMFVLVPSIFKLAVGGRQQIHSKLHRLL